MTKRRGPAEHRVLDPERGADGGAVVARRRLDEDLLERRPLEDLAVRGRVEGAAAREREARELRAGVEVVQDVEVDLLEDDLRARRDVRPLPEEVRVVRPAGRAEELDELVGVDAPEHGRALPAHLDALAVVEEVGGVERVAATVGGPDQPAELLDVRRLPVRREPHHLPLLAVLREPEELGHGRVEEAERSAGTRPRRAARGPPPRPTARMHRDEVAEAVHRDAGRLLERRDEERAREVGAVVADGVEGGAERRAERLGERACGAADLAEVRQATRDLPREAGAPQGAPGLAEEVGARVARDGDVVDLARGARRPARGRRGPRAPGSPRSASSGSGAPPRCAAASLPSRTSATEESAWYALRPRIVIWRRRLFHRASRAKSAPEHRPRT